MKIKVLSSKKYDDKNKNYGDCFIIDNGSEVVIYDCGSEEHADRIIKYIDSKGIQKVKVILSHNDSDHFEGILKLIDEGRVEKVYTILLLKYVDELLEQIDDGRKTRNSIKQQILKDYSNIAELGGLGILEDIWECKNIIDEIDIVGPSKEYMIKAFAKALDTTDGDTKDSETIVNATSVQASIDMGNGNVVLLCGDCSFTAIEDKVTNYNGIQLPHHGKKKQAEKIFEANEGRNEVKYFVSDNTGSTNGGSDKLITKGYDVENTQNGDIELDSTSFYRVPIGNYSMVIK